MEKILRNMMIVALVCSGVSAMAMTEEEQVEQAVRESLKESLATMSDEAKLKTIIESVFKDTLDKQEAEFVLGTGIAAAKRYLVLQASKSPAGPREAALQAKDSQEILRILKILKIRLKQLQ